MATSRDLKEMGALPWLVGCISEQLTHLKLTPIDPLQLSLLDRFVWVSILQDSGIEITRPTSILWSKWGSARYSRNRPLALLEYTSFESH